MANEKRDLILPPGTYAYMQDGTKGIIKVNTGPTVITPSAQDVPVVYDQKTGTFRRVETLEEALKKSPVIVEGYYANLLNPAKNRKQPEEAGSQQGTDLDVGRKVVIAGPAMFSLWPGQVAEVIRGHHLRSNQFLLVRVYNEDEARKNWTKAVVKPAADQTGGTKEEVKVATAPPPADLTVGKQLIIRGTEVSFYMPPTGVSVVQEGHDETGKANYVREALTLERLEYAILIDESGDKRYANGPSVVFPDPTERFMEGKNDDGQTSKKFRAIELNELQGLHLKVIADYSEKGVDYLAGQELFITGKDMAIYYPREEHSAVKYDGKTKHFATAIPVGEARYVLNRLTGNIITVKGPAMLLPDPRSEVIVRRILSDKQVSLWYPGNSEALAYNQSIRAVLSQVPTTRGAPSEGDLARSMNKSMRGATLSANVASGYIADSSSVSREQNMAGSEFSRSSSYTAPRSVTLDTKYQGVPVVEVWTGYAVLVVSKNGKRRVEKGPTVVQLDYDESFEVLELSTGKPKSQEALFRTVYLRTDNNQVTDILDVDTSDHIPVRLRLGYRVNFEGDSAKWWNVENYVKFLCDEMRSLLKGQVKKLKIEEFDANATDIVRNLILGTGGEGVGPKGKFFSANNMRITDVEVLGVEILNPDVKAALTSSQLAVVKTNIELSQLKRGLEVSKQKEAVVQEELGVKAQTVVRRNELDAELAASSLALTLVRLGNKLQEIETAKKTQAADEQLKDFVFDQELARDTKNQEQALTNKKATQELALAVLKAESETIIARFQAASGGFSEAVTALSNNETMVKVAESWNIQRAIGGDSISEAIAKMFTGTPLAGLVQKLATQNGNGASSNGSEKKSLTTSA